MSNAFTKEWWHAAAVRALKTMAQCAVAMLPAAATISAVDWQTVVGTAALSGVVSLLTSIAGLPEVQADNSEDNN
ncbi:MAG: holin [Galactobacillus timonensis]|uniref:holin n=1 Tax=Galactobacillus timonensis TaxID=2041840 RepID=UPI0023F13951|nr:holin [Galactobacillus timonensis]MCI6068368.1 holin [Galactobacillus timonensis]MCI6754207.1 holin [Galactobacillus timonensis]